MVGRVWSEISNGTWIAGLPAAAVLAVFLLLPADLRAESSGRTAGTQEEFHSLPARETVAARAAVPAAYLSVYSHSGVPQRLKHNVSYGSRQSSLPDFQTIPDVNAKKKEFFGFLKPLVEEENERLLVIRRRLGYIRDHCRFHKRISEQDRKWLGEVVAKFKTPVKSPGDPDFWPELLRRVDSVPVDLVLVPAANESAWGTSRFAREGNNLFGQWCFRPGCGMVPSGRPDGASYEVAAFDSVGESISSYMHNLNTGRVYEEFRRIRERCRIEGREPDAAELAQGLTSYSERGSAYVAEIQAMLRHNAPVIAQLGSR